MDTLSYLPSGDNGVLITFGNTINKDTNLLIRKYCNLIEKHMGKLQEIIEIIPAYSTLLIIYNPQLSRYHRLVEKLKDLTTKLGYIPMPATHIVHIPVLYGGEYGPDLEYVSTYNNLTIPEVIKIHTENPYLIYMLGFTPGFPYLGGLSEKIFTPRKKEPREKILGGSVAIAGDQTGIYPIDSPGGWQIIGRTPLKLFHPFSLDITLLKPGQYVKFYSIDMEQYEEYTYLISKNMFQVKESLLEGGEDFE